jgi:hypothetical protein
MECSYAAGFADSTRAELLPLKRGAKSAVILPAWPSLAQAEWVSLKLCQKPAILERVLHK